jgi:hypothetical protein
VTVYQVCIALGAKYEAVVPLRPDLCAHVNGSVNDRLLMNNNYSEPEDAHIVSVGRLSKVPPVQGSGASFLL